MSRYGGSGAFGRLASGLGFWRISEFEQRRKIIPNENNVEILAKGEAMSKTCLKLISEDKRSKKALKKLIQNKLDDAPKNFVLKHLGEELGFKYSSFKYFIRRENITYDKTKTKWSGSKGKYHTLDEEKVKKVIKLPHPKWKDKTIGVKGAAKILGVSQSTLDRYLKEHSIKNGLHKANHPDIVKNFEGKYKRNDFDSAVKFMLWWIKEYDKTPSIVEIVSGSQAGIVPFTHEWIKKEYKTYNLFLDAIEESIGEPIYCRGHLGGGNGGGQHSEYTTLKLIDWYENAETNPSIDFPLVGEKIIYKPQKSNGRMVSYYVVKALHREGQPIIHKLRSSVKYTREQWVKAKLHNGQGSSRGANSRENLTVEQVLSITPDYCPYLHNYFNVSKEDCRLWYHGMNGQILSNHDGMEEMHIPSLDKTNPSLGYFIENVDVTSWAFNRMKGQFTTENFFRVFKLKNNELNANRI